MRNALVFILLMGSVILFSCKKVEQEDQDNSHIIVKGILESGPSDAVIELTRVKGLGDQGETPVSGADVIIFGDDTEYLLIEDEDTAGLYRSSKPFVGTPGADYVLRVLHEDNRLTSQVTMPPAIQLVSASDIDVVIDPLLYDETVFSLEIVPRAGFAYLLALESLDPDPEPVVLNQLTGTFDFYYSLPFLEDAADIQDHYFTWYGQHELSIFRIDPQYESTFYANEEDGIYEYSEPDNIEGGSGVFAAVSRLSFILNVVEQ